MLTSSDGGNSWQEQFIDNFPSILKIEITGSSNALLLTPSYLLETHDYGTTFNAIANLPAGYSYKSLEMYSSLEGYALRFNYTSNPPYELGFTNDGGASWNWTPFSINTNKILSIYFTDFLHGVCFYEFLNYYRLAYTTDGGISWVVAMVGWESVERAIFRATDNGSLFVAFSDYYAQDFVTQILKSTDQGQTWTNSYAGEGFAVSDFKILGNDFLLMAGSIRYKKDNFQSQVSNVIYSTDGGLSWNNANFEDGFNCKSPRTLGLKNSQEAFIYNMDMDFEGERRLFRSLTTGQFVPFNPDNFTGIISDISFGSSKGYLISHDYHNTSTLLSTDGGITWSTLPAKLDGAGFRGVFTSDNYGYVCTHSNDADPLSWIYKMTNGAQSYTLIKTNEPGAPLMFEAFDPDTVILPKLSTSNPTNNKLMISSDGGSSWSETSPTNETLYDGDFLNGMIGCLFGGDSQGRVWLTLNGGESWSDFSFITGPLKKGLMITPHAAMAATTHEGIDKIIWIDFLDLSTTEVFAAPVNTSIRDFSFTDENTGYVLAITENTFTLYKTLNGGQDWSAIGKFYALKGLKIFYNENSFAFGEDGQLIRLGEGFPLKVENTHSRSKRVSLYSLASEKLLQVNIQRDDYLPGNLNIFDTKGTLLHQFKIHSSVQTLSHQLKPYMYLFRNMGKTIPNRGNSSLCNK